MRFTTYSHFSEVARFDMLGDIQGTSMKEINDKVKAWEREIDINSLSIPSLKFLQEVKDFCVDIDWDYSQYMKSRFSSARESKNTAELDFLQKKREYLNGAFGVNTFDSTVMDPSKDFAPWAVISMRFDYDGMMEYISSNDLSEEMGECTHQLEMAQKWREMRKNIREKIAALDAESESEVESEIDRKGYPVADGYMGHIGDDDYMLFATEGEYNEWLDDDIPEENIDVGK